MLPSSNRVKLNRVALKDVVSLKLAPRRRRTLKAASEVAHDSPKRRESELSESKEDAASVSRGRNKPSSTHPKGPGKQTETARHCPEGDLRNNRAVTQKAPRRNERQSCSRRDAECKQCGRSSKGKYRGDTSSGDADRLGPDRKVCSFRLVWCVCADSDSRWSRRVEVDRRPKATKMPSPLKLAPRKATGRQKSSNFRPYGGHNFRTGRGRSTFSSVGVRERGKAGSAGGNLGSTVAAALRVPAGTPQEPAGPSNFVQNARSKEYLRRSIGASLCFLCGDCKSIPPQRKSLGGQESKRSSLDSTPSPTVFQIHCSKRLVETTEKVWINEYPKVTLCDIAARCHVCSHDCCYVLPDDLKRKTVLCFKQDMRAGVWIWPSCSGQKKHDSEKGAAVKNGTGSPCVQNGNCIREAESLTEQHKHPEEDAHSEASKSPPKHFHNGWTKGDTTSPPPLLKDKCTVDEAQGSGVLDQDTQSSAALGSDLTGSEICRDERIKLGDGVERNRTCSLLSKESAITGPPDPPGDLAETSAQEISPDRFGESDEENPEEPESFTCQRVRPYFKEQHGSCARTYLSWPFSTNQPRCTISTADFSNTSIDSSLRSTLVSIAENPSLTPSFRGQNLNISSDATTVNQENRELSYSVQTNLKMVELSMQSEGSGKEAAIKAWSSSTLQFSRPETDTSTPPATHSVLSLSDWETSSALSNFSDLSTQNSPSSFSAKLGSVPPLSFFSGKNERKAVKETQPSLCNSLPLALQSTADCCQPLMSPISLRQNQSTSDECLPTRSPPILEPFDASPMEPPRFLCNVIRENGVDANSEFLLPPVLSPVSSPYRHLFGSSSFLSVCSSEETEKVMDKDETPMDFYAAQIINGNNETSASGSTSSPSDTKEEGHGGEKETSGDSDSEENTDQGERSSQQVPLDPQRNEAVGSPCSHDEEHTSCGEEDASSAAEDASSSQNPEADEGEAGRAEEQQSDILDEIAAYEQDILLVDVTQEDPELFENLPQESLLNLGPVRDTAPPKSKPFSAIGWPSNTDTSFSGLEQRLTPVTIDLHDDLIDIPEESESRPWRPRCSTIPTKSQPPAPVTVGRSRHAALYDGNNNHIYGGLDSFGRPIQTASLSHSTPPPQASGTWACLKNSASWTSLRCQKSNEYCRLYFSESQSCGYKMCRFQHQPVEGDEKFCVEMVAKFVKNPGCLQKAGAVYVGYYQNSPPGVYFSRPVLLSLLWALLKSGMASNVFSVLRVSLAHNIVPSHEFLLALFNYVRVKGLLSFIAELMHLTFKMVSAGLELNLDCLDNVKHTPMFQQMVQQNSHVALVGNHNLSACTPCPEFLNLVHGIVEIELCAKQEDWQLMGEVFRSICRFSHPPNQVERISGRVAIALLSESKGKVSLPFAAFAETVHQNESEESLVQIFLGRIGVSLMLRYHKNHHWIKGRRVVEAMSVLKVDYTTLKSLFGNEDGASRCRLITVATELFLLSGSVEGALNTLREHNWFLGSSLWPCEPADLEGRTNVLIRLVGKTSHRDTLEVLCNLPGVKEPNDSIDISRYSPLFTSHLQVCVERQILPVASDTLDFMLGKKLPVDHSLLQKLLEKLGRQNLWLRAREVFKHCLSMGYYPAISAPPGSMLLIVPCQLGEVELALTLEMFVAFNASAILPLSETATSSLSITLKRTQSCESEYISAGNRLLSAACLPQPKLIVRYTAVSSSQEQMFRLDVSTARRWLRHNHLWASEMWTHRPKCLNPN